MAPYSDGRKISSTTQIYRRATYYLYLKVVQLYFIINPKQNKLKNATTNKKEAKTPLKSTVQISHFKEQKMPAFSIPASSKLNEIYMDAQQVALELNISKRTIHNMRKRGKFSFTCLGGKIFYFRLEIVAMLEANKISQKDIISMRKINQSLRKTDK